MSSETSRSVPSERAQHILRVLVEHYIRDGQPVGSRTLALPAPMGDTPVQVSCTREPATGTVDEGGLRLASYRVVAQVTSGASDSNTFVQRQVEARHTVCKNPGAQAPRFAC